MNERERMFRYEQRSIQRVDVGDVVFIAFLLSLLLFVLIATATHVMWQAVFIAVIAF